jgi:NAD(P)-dependent dehydrogenase (short-subunit alcohol dehydrogenase family)
MHMTWSLDGKTVLVTGPTAGIGRVTAIELAKRAREVVLLCRSREKGEALRAEIAATTGPDRASVLVCDLASLADVRRAAAEFLASARPLHVLVNNAGVVNLRRAVTVDGIETTFAVNHLGHFLLTNLLLDRLVASAPARIVNVASDAHHWGTIDFDDLEGERRYRWMGIYGRSKLANVLFTRELARRLDGTGVTVNALHPGAIATQLGANNGWVAALLLPVIRPFMRTPEQGAATSIHLASAPEVSGVTGGYFADSRPKPGSAESRDMTIARRLWEVSARMTGLPA